MCNLARFKGILPQLKVYWARSLSVVSDLMLFKWMPLFVKVVSFLLFVVSLLALFSLILPVFWGATSNMSSRQIFLSALVSLAAAAWWRTEAKRVAKREKSSSPSWRNALFLMFLVAGSYGVLLGVYGKLIQHNLLFGKGAAPPNPNDLLTAFGFIMAVVTAYYLVVLQGTANQAKELLAKLSDSKTEIDSLKEDMRSLDDASLGIFTSIGQFVYDLSSVIQLDLPPAALQQGLQPLTAVLEKLLALHQIMLVWHETPAVFPSELTARLEELWLQLENSDSAGLNYIPSGLLKEIRRGLQDGLQNSAMDAATRDEMKQALGILSKLERALPSYQ